MQISLSIAHALNHYTGLNCLATTCTKLVYVYMWPLLQFHHEDYFLIKRRGTEYKRSKEHASPHPTSYWWVNIQFFWLLNKWPWTDQLTFMNMLSLTIKSLQCFINKTSVLSDIWSHESIFAAPLASSAFSVPCGFQDISRLPYTTHEEPEAQRGSSTCPKSLS